MTTWFIAVFWMGGVCAAFNMNRAHDVGLAWSVFSALVWPAGLAYGLCLRFYVNSDWKDAGR